MNSNDTQELREQILTEFKQVLKTAPFDHTENCTNIVMRLIAQHDTAYREGLLEALPTDAVFNYKSAKKIAGFNDCLLGVRTLIATYGTDKKHGDI